MPEIIDIKSIDTYTKNCYGCQLHKKDVMVTIYEEGDESSPSKFTDIFLTNSQAKQLIKDLIEVTYIQNEKD